ncbi:MAG: hypothetical protein AB8U72_04605 [Anaplasma ovis]
MASAFFATALYENPEMRNPLELAAVKEGAFEARDRNQEDTLRILSFFCV